jgi:hypothetical protein
LAGFEVTTEDMTINLAQQVVLGDLVFQSKVVEQRSTARLLTHHFGVPPKFLLST